MRPDAPDATSDAAPLHRRIAWRRALIVALPVFYAAGAAWRRSEPSPRAWLGIGLGVAVALSAATVRDGEEPGRVRARAWCATALALAVATAGMGTRFGPLMAARSIALLGACVVALRAVDAIEVSPGLAARATEALAARTIAPRWIVRAAIVASTLAWGTAAAVDGVGWAGGGWAALSSNAPLVVATAAALSVFAMGSAAMLVAGARRLELGAPPRARAAAAACAGALVLAIGLAATETLRPEAATSLSVALACPVIVRICAARDTQTLARRARRAITLLVYGAPVCALAALAAGGPRVGLVSFVLAGVTMAIGAFATRLEEPLLADRGVLRDALAEATRAAHDRDTRGAIAKALSTLRAAAGQDAPSPELWMLHPTRIFTVDAAGYLREREGELPPSLLELAQDEPHGTLRVEILRALEIRGAELRPLLRWMDDRGALFATLVAEGEEPDGVVIVPMGSRDPSLTAEEVFAAKSFADTFVAVCQASSARARHLRREQELKETIDRLEDRLARAEHDAALEASRHALASARLARPATVGIYSAASRMAYEALERRLEQDAPAVLVAPAGADPVPYVARAHLSGPRKARPLVVVDGTSSREHDQARWRDERSSPLALAHGGLLVLVDGAALPRDVQVLVARALTERRPPWERPTPLDVAITLTVTASASLPLGRREAPLVSLVDDGRLSPELHARFAEVEPIVLPGLSERSEDLFSMVADRLAREGLRVHGKPIGIDGAAFARLVEHPFEGEDAELASIVSRLVSRAVAQGDDVVRARHVEELALARSPEEDESREPTSDDRAPSSEERAPSGEVSAASGRPGRQS